MQITDFSPVATNTQGGHPDESPSNIQMFTPLSARDFDRPMLIDIKTRKSYQVDEVIYMEPPAENKIIKVKKLLEFTRKQ